MATPTELRSKDKALAAASQRAIKTLDAAFNEDTLEGMLRLLEVATATHVVQRKGRRAIATRERPGDVLSWSIGQKIRAARERKGWLQEDLAKASGIARANIARLERGRHTAHLSTLRRAAKALEIGVETLLKAPQAVSSAKELAEARSSFSRIPTLPASRRPRSAFR